MPKPMRMGFLLFAILTSFPLVALGDPLIPSGIDPTKDWPWWRGPTRDNKAAPGNAIPTTFSATENVLWKAPVPGRGHASPTIVGDAIYLATADAKAGTQSVVAFDRLTGTQRWATVVNTGELPAKIHSKNTHASGTVASDGERVFAIYYNRGAIQIAALDLRGKILWQKHVGPFEPKKYEFGYGASPLLYGGNVIVVADYEGGGFLVALDCTSGEEKWKTARPKLPNYSSPIVAPLAKQHQLLISGCELMASYDPITGKLRWSAETTSPQTCGTVVWDGDLVFASGGYPNKRTVAVRADGSGVVAWANGRKAYEQSMLAHEGFLYAIDDGGRAYCWRAKDGQEMWAHRFKGPISASPVLMGDLILAANELGDFFLYRAKPEACDVVAKNRLGDEVFATPAVCGGRLYIRVSHVDESDNRGEMLYCIGDR